METSSLLDMCAVFEKDRDIFIQIIQVTEIALPSPQFLQLGTPESVRASFVPVNQAERYISAV